MRAYALKRIGLVIPTLVLVSIIIFVAMRVLPGDPAVLKLIGLDGEGSYTAADLAKVKAELGTDRPLLAQYGTWVWGVVRGDFGKSFWYGIPVMREVKQRFPVTLELAMFAILIAVLLAVPLGVLSAIKQDTWIDYATRVFTISGVALPTFWIGILVIFSMARWLHWLPPLGYATPWEDPWTNFKQLIFPALALGFHDVAFIARVTRSAMLEVLREDYVRTARAKGLTERTVFFVHALKNSFLPVVTVSGWQFGRLMGGVVLIEAIFVVPGTGSLLIESVSNRDFTMIQALILVAAIVVLAVNLLVDLAYGWLDPRIRYS